MLPFLLRRLKEDVLHDLPPKIIQDYQCDLSDLQKHLYDDFSNSQANEEAESAVKSSGGGEQKHVFQALQYLRKLCNHPALVLKNMAEEEAQALVGKFSKNTPSSLRDIEHAPKLQALKYVALTTCGETDVSTGKSFWTAVSVRVLVLQAARPLRTTCSTTQRPRLVVSRNIES